ncbi:peroxisomal membrane anchor protein conserved region-domain-containing protein [Umbelopsis sp. AD052]|nr:peroxisomal membrane anchor protein conserved region-domain-containing protein [Umbelopsis sp. AD052]
MSDNDDNQPPKQDQVRELLGPSLTPEQREEKRKALVQRQKDARAGADLSTLLAQQPPSSTESSAVPEATKAPVPVVAAKASEDLPLREDLIKPAVSFLSSPNVRSADRAKKLAFLQKKGLNQREIQEAFQRVGETKPDSTAIAEAAKLPQPSAAPASSSMPQVPSRVNQPPQVIYVQTPPPATVPIDKVVTMAVIIAVGAVTATTGLVALVKRIVNPTFQAYFEHRRKTYEHRRALLESLNDKLKQFNKVPKPTKVTITDGEEDTILAESEEKEFVYTKIEDAQKKMAKDISRLSTLVATLAATQGDNPLRVALTSLISYLTQSTYSYSYSYLNSSNSGSGVPGVDTEAKEIQDIKSEIRSLKGFLLNRRNFPSAAHIQPSRSMPNVPTYHKKPATEVEDKAGK